MGFFFNFDSGLNVVQNSSVGYFNDGLETLDWFGNLHFFVNWEKIGDVGLHLQILGGLACSCLFAV